MEIFGERLKKIRTDRQLSMSELAKRIGTSQQNVSRWEVGETMPTGETLIMLSKFLKVSTDFLLGLKED